MLEYIIKNELHVIFVQDILVFLVVGFFSGIKEKKSYFLWSLFLTIILTVFYTKINLLATGLLWLILVILVFAYLKKINRAVLCASLTILLYIFANYLAGMLLAIGNSKFVSSLEVSVILSSVIYIVIVFGVKQASMHTWEKVHVSERLAWLSAILSTVTFISYFIIIVIERFGGERSSMGQANEIFIIGYGVLSTLVFLVLLYSLQKEYVMKEKQKEMQYLKEYTDQLEKNYTEMRRFKHDYQNILFSIEEYIQEKDLVKLEEYFYTKIKKVSTSVTEKNMNLTKLKKKFSTNNNQF